MFFGNDSNLLLLFRIQNMIRVINRLIGARYKLRALETSTIAFPFNIMKDPRWVSEFSSIFVIRCLMFRHFFVICSLSFQCRYALVRNAGTEAVQRFVHEGLGQSVKKSNLLTWKEERVVLDNEGAIISHPQDLNSQMGYFLCRNFFIRGQNELQWTNANQFQLLINSMDDEFLRCLFFFFFWLYFCFM